MSDIMELIVSHKDAFCDYVISGKRYAEARECYAMLESRISAMQEVVDAAILYNNGVMEICEFSNVVDGYTEVIKE